MAGVTRGWSSPLRSSRDDCVSVYIVNSHGNALEPCRFNPVKNIRRPCVGKSKDMHKVRKLEITCDGVSIRAELSSGILERKMVNFKLGRQTKEKLFDLSQRERKKKNPSLGEKLNPRPSDYWFLTPPLSTGKS